MQTPTFISKLSDGNVIFRLDVGKKLKPEIFQIRYGCGYDCDSIIFISGLFLREKESSGTG
jgi:hypothetical protein